MKSIICLLLVLCVQLAAQSRSSKMNPAGETAVSASLGKVKLHAVFNTSIVKINTDDKIPQFPQCTYSRFPCVVVQQLRLSVNDVRIFVPRSAYADLGDIQSAEFSNKAGRFILTIKGGDASESYIAQIVFSKRLQERRLYSAEDPIHPLEVTHYYDVSSIH